MNPVLVVALSNGITFSADGGGVKIDRKQVCIAQVCRPVGEVVVRADGSWFIEAAGLELRWVGQQRALVRVGNGEWMPGTLTHNFGVTAPWSEVDLQPGWEHGVLPGVWLRATDNCKKGTVAWLFVPVVRNFPETVVRRVGAGWAVSTGGSISKCVGDFGGVTDHQDSEEPDR